MRTNTNPDAPRRNLWRSRWAAIGAAVAVSVGSGGLFVANAATGAPSSVVTIDPVRVLDTRDPVNTGLAGPFVSAVPQKLQITGGVVPVGATGVLLNVTVVSPTADGYVSVRPGDATGAPSTSSLNFTAGDIVPNAVQVALPTTGPNAGQIDITYDAFGVTGPTTEVLADIVGYLVPGAAGPAGPAGPAGMSFIADYNFNGSTGMTSTVPVANAPAGYSATVNLAAGRYFVTGDLTVWNSGGAGATATCNVYVNSTRQESASQQSIPAADRGNLAISGTFVLLIGGPTVVDFRCSESGSYLLSYNYANLTIFKVG